MDKLRGDKSGINNGLILNKKMFSIENYTSMTEEELLENIRKKIQQVLKNKP